MIALFLAAVMQVADTNHFVICPTLPPTSDSATRTLYAHVGDPFTQVALPAGFTGLVAEAVQAKMTVPADLPLVVFDGHGPTVATTAAFSLMRSGEVKNIAVMASSSSPTIDSLLTVGIERAAKDTSYPPLPPGAGSGIRLAMTLSTDSVAGDVPMFSLRLPIWRAFVLPHVARKEPPLSAAQERAQTDTTQLTFIVDEHGMPLLGTMLVTSAPIRGVPLGYLTAFRNNQLVPAHIGSCAVRALLHVRGTIASHDTFVPEF